MSLTLPDELLERGHIRAERDGAVLCITLDRPEARNAQTPATWAALAAVGRVTAASDVALVVIRGAGSAFSAGLDRRMFAAEGVPGEASLAQLVALDDADLAARIAVFQEGFTWQRQVPALTVAAVHGPAIGAGFQLALACDLLLATPEASFAMRETSYGLVPDLAGTQPLVRSVGYSRAVEICATGRTIDAREGYALGFVTRVVDDLEAEIAGLSDTIARTPPGAVRDLLPLLRSADGTDRDLQAERERLAQVARLRALLGGG